MKKHSILLSTLSLAFALPAFAQDGFRVALSVGSMKTTGDAAQFGTSPANPLTGQMIDFDQPNQSPMALDLAWVKDDDEWSLTYFTTKKKSSKTMIDATNGVATGTLPIFIADAGLTGNRELKATLIDLGWKHTFVKGEQASLAVSMGLRYSKQSDERSYQQLSAAGVPENASLHMKGEGTGFGLSMGLHGRYAFTDRMWLTSGFTATLLNNTTKAEDYTGYNLFAPSVQASSSDNHRSLLQTDAYLRYNINFVSTFNGYLGYEVRDFNSEGARIQNNLTKLGLPGTSGFGLSGFTLGLSYTF